jgi:hypothetical protein
VESRLNPHIHTYIHINECKYELGGRIGGGEGNRMVGQIILKYIVSMYEDGIMKFLLKLLK